MGLRIWAHLAKSKMNQKQRKDSQIMEVCYVNFGHKCWKMKDGNLIKAYFWFYKDSSFLKDLKGLKMHIVLWIAIVPTFSLSFR